jgi:hypothetical protein
VTTSTRGDGRGEHASLWSLGRTRVARDVSQVFDFTGVARGTAVALSLAASN